MNFVIYYHVIVENLEIFKVQSCDLKFLKMI